MPRSSAAADFSNWDDHIGNNGHPGLGIDCQTAFPDHSSRPVPILNDGTPIRELI